MSIYCIIIIYIIIFTTTATAVAAAANYNVLYRCENFSLIEGGT